MSPSNAPPFERLARPDGHFVAYNRLKNRKRRKLPGLVFCPGYKSDKEGTKALAVEQWARDNGRASVRFDYLGHGQSSGDFETEGCISRWAEDTIAVLDELTEGPQIIIGSSMGGWTSLLAAQARPEKVKGLVLIAPAPDFTQRMWGEFSDAVRKQIRTTGRLDVPSDYSDEPYYYTFKLFDDGQNNLMLDRGIKFTGPVRILQGMKDDAVPWETMLDIQKSLKSDDVSINLFKNGDHRLSTERDIATLLNTIDQLSEQLAE